MKRPSGLFNVNYNQEVAFIRTPFQWGMLGLGLLLAYALPLFIPMGWWDFFIKVWITAIGVLGLTLLTGYCGQISLGHTGFMAVGAFVGAILLGNGVPLVLALLLAGVAAGAVGIIFGLPAVRVKGFYLAFSTLAAFYIIHFVLVHYAGGDVGHIVLSPSIFGFSFDSDFRIYYLALTICVIMTYFAKNIARCKWGRAFIATRDHDIAANTLGVNINFYKLMAFFIGCFYAGVAGLVLVIYMGWASVDYFTLFDCIWYLGMIIVGGISSISGAFMGVFFILGISQIGSAIAPDIAKAFPQVAGTIIGAIPVLLVGLALVILIIWEPRGLVHRWNILKNSVRLFPFAD